MAQAQATLKVSPRELQVIDDALRMYAYVNRDLARPEDRARAHPLDGFQHIIRGGDARMLVVQADKLRKDIGMK